jgi:hypothetical protein
MEYTELQDRCPDLHSRQSNLCTKLIRPANVYLRCMRYHLSHTEYLDLNLRPCTQPGSVCNWLRVQAQSCQVGTPYTSLMNYYQDQLCPGDTRDMKLLPRQSKYQRHSLHMELTPLRPCRPCRQCNFCTVCYQ